jgi:SOS response regulatory protein OraA/RecX
MTDHDRAGGEPGAAAYAKALELLAARAHFAAELSAKLESRGFSRDAAAAALDRLTAAGQEI